MRDSRQKYHAPKVEKIVLSEKHMMLRLIAAAVFLVIGAATLAITFSSFVSSDEGWQEITVLSNSEVNCSQDFSLMYQLGTTELSVNKEKKAIAEIYTEACIRAYQIFCEDGEAEEDLSSAKLYILNHHPNEVVSVDPVLYEALLRWENSGLRNHYLGPIYETMKNLYSCELDEEAKQFDPLYSQETSGEFAKLLQFIQDPSSIHLEFYEENQVCLSVSSDYLAFAEEDGTEDYISLYYYRNAMICDYIADTLIAAGYTNGTLSSSDGYSRMLEQEQDQDHIIGSAQESSEQSGTASGSEEQAGNTLQLYTREGATVRYAGEVTFAEGSKKSILTLRDFPAIEADRYQYFVYSDGQLRTPYISTADGLCHSAVTSLTACSGELDCTGLLLSVLGSFLEEPGAPALEELQEPELLWFEGSELHTTLTDAVVNRESEMG